jgi:hypothetical protein
VRIRLAISDGEILDVSNIHASACNLGFGARQWLDRAPLAHVAYVHVGGGVARGGLWHDTHAHKVPEGALALLRDLGRRAPISGALLERDDRFPSQAEVNRDASAAAFAPAPALPAGPPPRRVATRLADLDRAALAEAQARLVGALVAGEPVPAGFDVGRIGVEAETLLAKRLRAADRALPDLDLEGALRERFLSWARANPPSIDDCGCADQRDFTMALSWARAK